MTIEQLETRPKDRAYRRGKLNPAIKRYIKAREQELDRTCRSIWSYTNEHGLQFLFATFCRNHNRLIVTIGSYSQDVAGNFIPERTIG